MDKSTKAISKYLADNGMTIKHLSEKTNIPYPVLFRSLSKTNGTRDLRGDELITICKVLKIDPLSIKE